MPDALGPTVHTCLGIAILEAKLGSNHDLVAHWRECLAHHLLIREGAVGFRGVKESHTALERVPNQRNSLLFLQSGAIAKTQPHAAETHGRDFEAAFSQFARLHRRSSVRIRSFT